MNVSSTQAIFLSYTRDDLEAARRVADALRGHGLEVWFDQDELGGGDAWDQKIRRQIKECALFVPLISTHTQQRREGYFRLEWKLAAERTHLMAEGVPFIAPVAIDDTPEAAAIVPAEFMRVQWTRLPGGHVTPAFVDQIKRLLAPGPAPAPVGGSAVVAVAAPARRASSHGIAIALGAAVLALVAYIALRPAAKDAAPARPAAAEPTPVASDKSIAVLPFVNRSTDRENEFFTDGVHEDILTNLALIREFRVVSRTSVMGYRGTTKKIRDIGAELGVAYLLEGSVQRAGGKVRVTGQLIRAATDEHIWAKAYDRDLTDVFAIQSALAQEIAAALQTALSPQEKKFLARRTTENPAAYDLYLQARPLILSTNTAGRLRAETLLQSAVELDPNFAEAWGALANIHGLAIGQGNDTSAARLAQASAAADRAQALAPDVPEVMRRIGLFYLTALADFPRAIEQFEKTVRLQPNYGAVHGSLGLALRKMGRWTECLTEQRRAGQLDPGNLSGALLFVDNLRRCRRFDEAATELQRVVTLAPGRLDERAALARAAFLARGSTRESAEFFASLPADQASSPRALALRKDWAAATGNFAEARRFDAMQPYFDGDAEPRSTQALAAAAVALALGDATAARARLENFPAELRARLENEPTNAFVWCELGQMEALLGHHDEALRCARKAVELKPIAVDAHHGTRFSLGLAVSYAWTGDKDAALAELTRLLRVPSEANVHELKTGPWFAALGGDPRFAALLNDPKNNAPLF